MVSFFIPLVGLATSLMPIYAHHNAVAACNEKALGDSCTFKEEDLTFEASRCIEDPYPTYTGNLLLVCDMTQGSVTVNTPRGPFPVWVQMGGRTFLDSWQPCNEQINVMRAFQRKFDPEGIMTLNGQDVHWCEVQFQEELEAPEMLCTFREASTARSQPLHPKLREAMLVSPVTSYVHAIPHETLIDVVPNNVKRDTRAVVEHLHLPCLGKNEGDTCDVTLSGQENLTIFKSKCVYRTSTGFLAPKNQLICDDADGQPHVDGDPLTIWEDQGNMNLYQKMIAYCAESKPSKPSGYCQFAATANLSELGVVYDCVYKSLADVQGNQQVLDSVTPVNFYSYDGTKFASPAMAFSGLASLSHQLMTGIIHSAKFGLVFTLFMVIILLGTLYLLYSLTKLWQKLWTLEAAFIQRYGDLANTPYF